MENLRTVLHGAGEPVRAVDGVDLEIRCLTISWPAKRRSVFLI